MKAVTSAVRFLVFTNIYISLCVVCFTSKTALMLHGTLGNVHVNLLAFSATWFLYGFHRVYRRFRLFEDEHKEERHHWVDKRKALYYTIIGLAFVSTCIQLFSMPLRVFVALIPVGFIAGGYSIPFIKTKNKVLRLRDISWLKALWIGISYAWLTTFLPVVYDGALRDILSPQVLYIFAENLVFMFVLAVPFDIRDINYDKRNGVNTLPVLLGVKGAIRLCLILLLCFAIMVRLHVQFAGLNGHIEFALYLSAFEIACLIPFSKPERPNLFFPLVIESSMIIQWALILLVLNYV